MDIDNFYEMALSALVRIDDSLRSIASNLRLIAFLFWLPVIGGIGLGFLVFVLSLFKCFQ